MINSSIVNQTDIESEEFQKWSKYWSSNKIIYNRKSWEWGFICHNLSKENILTENKIGLGFAVGREPLPTIFAKEGCTILASDAPLDNNIMTLWNNTNQHCNELDNVYYQGLLDKNKFLDKVQFRPIDMTNLPTDLNNQFDFIWSTCAIEHIGGINKGLQFVIDSLNYLKNGGIAIHTTEFNLSSNTDTIDNPTLCLFRINDFLELEKRIFNIATIDPLIIKDNGCEHDLIIDKYPYKSTHLKLDIGGYVATCIGIIIRKK